MKLDEAKSLASSQALSQRRDALLQPHMSELVAFVQELRKAAPSGVPDFDPFDGGSAAEILFLLEAPGNKAIGSGFISRNNPDETAKNFFLANHEAGLSRKRTITWNAVPWYVGSETRIRPVTPSDLASGGESLQQLFQILRELKVVVLIGRKAQRVHNFVRQLAPHVEVLECPHPSPRWLNGRPDQREKIVECLRRAKKILNEID